jgi:hypothetical protein
MFIVRLLKLCCGCAVLLLAVGATVLTSGCATTVPGAPLQSVEVKFIPKAPSQANGASWSGLVPFIDDDLVATGNLGIGDWFPVSEPDGPELFRLHLVSGDNEAIVIEARRGQIIRRMELKRDSSASCKIAGGQYEFTYPSQWVGRSSLPKSGTSGFNELTSEGYVSKIMLMVRRIPIIRE